MDTHKINGHTVNVEDGAEGGLRYLRDTLDSNESHVFFNQAKSRGRADFEVPGNINYTLTHNNDATYTISRRS